MTPMLSENSIALHLTCHLSENYLNSDSIIQKRGRGNHIKNKYCYSYPFLSDIHILLDQAPEYYLE